MPAAFAGYLLVARATLLLWQVLALCVFAVALTLSILRYWPISLSVGIVVRFVAEVRSR